jgi:hypothetical protein
MRIRPLALLPLMAVLGGCPLSFDPEASVLQDATVSGQDGGGDADGGTSADTGLPPPDGGVPMDAGPPPDVGPPPDGGPGSFRLTVVKSGDGDGVITSVPGGIDCGLFCASPFPAGTLVTLQVTPSPGSSFSRWTGACSGDGLCQLRMTEDAEVTAVFEAQPVTVTATVDGPGRLLSLPTAIDCPGACSAERPYGSNLTFTAAPTAPGAALDAWTGDCAGTTGPTCTLFLDGPKTVGARFAVRPVRLVVRRNGAGQGSVGSDPAGIDCGASCEASFPAGTELTLRATPAMGSGFVGWGGACSGSGVCVLRLDADQTVEAEFGMQLHRVQVTRAGAGSGLVSSNPGGIGCGGVCEADFAEGSVIVLTASPDATSRFAGWGGACAAFADMPCRLPIDGPKQIEARFEPRQATLDVVLDGNGGGLVTSSPAGILCGELGPVSLDCSETYTPPADVVLEARSGPGSTFGGWSGGGCTGTGPCRLRVTADVTVTATFRVPATRLVVRREGNGAGRVVSTPAGIDCPGTCEFEFPRGSSVQLTPTPDAGSGFAGWAGDCTRADDCRVTMDQARQVDARFQAGLVAYWPLDDHARDVSGHGHNGANNGANGAEDRTGSRNRALNFGTGDFIEVPNGTDLSGFASHTICAWVRPTRSSNNTMFVAAKTFLFDNTASSDAYSLMLSGGTRPVPQARAWTTNSSGNDDAQTADANRSAQIGTWIHLCGRYDGQQLSIWLGGQSSGTANLSGTVNQTTSTFRIGRCNGAQGQCDRYPFFGDIDEVKLFSRALDPMELAVEATP